MLVGLFGIVGAVVSYRADVHEARLQVQVRLEQQGRLYSDSLALHFDVLKAELQHLADWHVEQLHAGDEVVLTAIRDDRGLFGGGVALVAPDGTKLWSEPSTALVAPVQGQPWFQRVLGSEAAAIDAWVDDGSALIAIALPVRENGKLGSVLVGIVDGSDRLLYGVEGPGEHLLLLSCRDRVLVPPKAPSWAGGRVFSGWLDTKRTRPGDSSWAVDSTEVIAQLFPVRGTSLVVLAMESEVTSVAPIRNRLALQLAFLLLLQVVTLGAFSLFLRRTWRAFTEAEARITEQEKLAALGTAASLIAHEVKNSLNGLRGAVSLLHAGGDAGLVSKTVKGQVDRLGHLASSLLSFSRKAEARAVPLDLEVVTREVVDALQTLPEAAEATVSLELGGPLSLSTDPLLLTTAIDNLVRNAVEAAVAAKDLGRVTQPEVRVEGRREGDWAVLRVEDNGGGPPPGFEERLGEPFYTTKPRGIGLGLTMTTRAAEQLGGRVTFHRIAQGSRFELWLPDLSTGERVR